MRHKRMDYFAYPHSPSRERREAWLAYNDPDPVERKNGGERPTEQQEGTIDASREITSRRAGEIAPDKELLLSSEELWLSLVVCSDINDAVGPRIKEIAKRDGLTLETAGKDPERRRAIVSEMLQDPEIELALIQRIEQRMTRHASFKRSLQAVQHFTEDTIDQPDATLPTRERILESLLRKNEQLVAADQDATLEQWLAHATSSSASREELDELNLILGTSFTVEAPPTHEDQRRLIRIAESILATKTKCDDQDRNIYARNLPDGANEQTVARAREGFRNLHRALDTALRQDVYSKVREVAHATEQALQEEIQTLVNEPYAKFAETYSGEDPFGAFSQHFFEQHRVHVEEVLAAQDAALSACQRANPGQLEEIASASVPEIMERYSISSEQEAQDIKQDATIALHRMRGHELRGFDDPEFTRKAGAILADVTPVLKSTVVERAQERRSQLELLREAHAPTLQKAVEMLSKDETHIRAEAVLGAEFVSKLRATHGAFTKGELQASDQLDSTDHIEQFQNIVRCAEFIVNGDIWRMQTIAPTTEEAPADAEAMETERVDLLTRLDAVHEPLLRNLNDYQVCRLLDITAGVEQVARSTRAILAEYLPNATAERPQSQAKLRQAREATGKLERLAHFLENPPPVHYFEDTNANNEGYCEFSADPNAPPITGIYINTVGSQSGVHRSRAELDATKQHEMGHAIVHMATEEIGLIHSREKFTALRSAIAANEDGQRTLDEAAGVWGLKDQKERLIRFALQKKGIDPDSATQTQLEQAEQFYDDKVIEELLCTLMSINDTRKRKEAEGKTYNPAHDTTLSAPTRQLWSLLSAQNDAEEAAELNHLREALGVPQQRYEVVQLFSTATGGASAGGPSPTPTAPTASPDQEGSARADLERIEWYMSRIKDFLDLSRFAQHSEEVRKFYDEAQQRYTRAKYIFANGRDLPAFGGAPIDPENNTWYRTNIGKFKTTVENYAEDLMKIVREHRDLRGEPPRKRSLFEIIFTDTKWISLMDIKKMVTDAAEDLKRMWERRSQTARNRLGSIIAGVIPDNEIPLLNYFGRLKYEFKRRNEEYELEEVGVWEKALEQLGPNQLLETLTDIRSAHDRDRMKAVMNLLAKFGRIDWDDERIWDALNRVGNFRLPKDLCRYDRFTREEWIKKIVFSAWPTDKDLFNKWNTGNASAFTSKRNEYEAYADVRANTRELPHECARMLRIYTQWKEEQKNLPASQQKPMPDDVNPYAYEKLIHYSMVNGKMSMEQKFFYLIQGVDVGLLPLERINILNKEVLGNFPFIDYFTSQNNTHQEIRAIAAKLRETDNLGDLARYKPGQKTKVWLQLVVARDESTRQRAAKVMSRGGDQIDHEDIPMLVSILDLNDMDELLSVQRGSQQRVTKEGLKNGYVGYGNVFQTYAQLAALSQDPTKGVHFTEDDAEAFGKRMMAYLFFDNLVTGTPSERRPSLSWGKINNETMPSGGGRAPKAFRNPVNEVIEKVMVDIYGLSDLPITNKEKDPTTGSLRTGTVSLDQFLGARRGDTDVNKDDLMLAAQQHEDPIILALKRNVPELVRILSSYAYEDSPDHWHIPNEGDPDKGESITRDHIEQIRKL
ncbi:MAG: hypothetical protein ABIA92_03945 [Patescibacteria group bacterium]